jgi:hypothetical protein
MAPADQSATERVGNLDASSQYLGIPVVTIVRQDRIGDWRARNGEGVNTSVTYIVTTA